MKYKDEKFYWTCQRSVRWPDDYIGPDSMTQWIIEKSDGFTDVGLLRISESVRAYAYLILSSQASARSSIVENSTSALTAQSAFLNNFENVVNRRVDIREDIKRYQHTLSYVLSKVNYSVGENIYMLPSNMNLKIRSGTVGYNNKILVSDEKFSLGKNVEVNALVLEEPVIPMPKGHPSHKVVAQQTLQTGVPLRPHTHTVAQQPWALQAHELAKNQISLIKRRNCIDSLSGRWFCLMEYFSMN